MNFGGKQTGHELRPFFEGAASNFARVFAITDNISRSQLELLTTVTELEADNDTAAFNELV